MYIACLLSCGIKVKNRIILRIYKVNMLKIDRKCVPLRTICATKKYMNKIKKIPYGMTDLETIIREGYYYELL